MRCQICYGLTESSPVTFQTSPEDPIQQRVSTVGKVHLHTEVCLHISRQDTNISFTTFNPSPSLLFNRQK